MPRAVDHLVIPARDLAAQAELYRRLGFQVGARNRHPWGTENHIVQFDGAFLELIGLGDGFALATPASGVFSFAQFVAQFLAQREGLAMLVMRSSDAEADRREFAAGGLGEFERFDFARKAKRPDGSTVDVAFSLAFAVSPALPETGFFVCQQHFPENFWNASAQVHPNSAKGVVGLAFAHEAPDEAARFLVPFLGAPGALSNGAGVTIEAAGTRVEVAPRATLIERYGEAIPESGAVLALMRIGVGDIETTSQALLNGGVAAKTLGKNSLVVGAADAMGVAIVFEPT
jgi:hypothetical protein